MTKTKSSAQAEGEVTDISGVLHITPSDGCVVRKPNGSLLDAQGEPVNVDEDKTYWLRRIADRDVTATLFSDGEAE